MPDTEENAYQTPHYGNGILPLLVNYRNNIKHMFGKVKNFVVKKLLERQLKDAPPEQRELIMTLLEKNPELFEKIAAEIQSEIKSGKDQMSAAMKVMPKYQKELQMIMGDKMPKIQVQGTRFNQNGSIHR